MRISGKSIGNPDRPDERLTDARMKYMQDWVCIHNNAASFPVITIISIDRYIVNDICRFDSIIQRCYWGTRRHGVRVSALRLKAHRNFDRVVVGFLSESAHSLRHPHDGIDGAAETQAFDGLSVLTP